MQIVFAFQLMCGLRDNAYAQLKIITTNSMLAERLNCLNFIKNIFHFRKNKQNTSYIIYYS